jgi:hypothetical protein
MSKRKDKGRLAPFVPLDQEVMSSPAWRATSHGARLLYVHLKRRWSFKQRNNGRIFLSHRDAQAEIGGNLDSVGRWFRELQHYGFIVMTEAGCLGSDGKGKAPRWRLTELEALGGRNGNTWMLPTKDFNRWDGTKFRDDRGAVKRERERKRRTVTTDHEKQNPVPQTGDRVSRKQGTGLSRKQGTVDGTSVPQRGDISDHPPVPQRGDRSRSTTRVARGRGDLEGEIVTDWPRPDSASPNADDQQVLRLLAALQGRKGPRC